MYTYAKHARNVHDPTTWVIGNPLKAVSAPPIDNSSSPSMKEKIEAPPNFFFRLHLFNLQHSLISIDQLGGYHLQGASIPSPSHTCLGIKKKPSHTQN